MLVFTAVLTALYMTRLWRITFFGEARSEAAAHAHESGAVMVVPLVVLAVGAALGGYGFFHDHLLGGAFRGVLALVPEPEGPAHWMMITIGTRRHVRRRELCAGLLPAGGRGPRCRPACRWFSAG